MDKKQLLDEPAVIKQLYKELLKSKFHVFPDKGKVNVSDKHGVYIIYSDKKQALHVGSTPKGRKGLNQRLYNHLTKSSVFYDKYLRRYKINMRGTHMFKYLEVADARQRALLEAYAAGCLCPAHFGTGEKD